MFYTFSLCSLLIFIVNVKYVHKKRKIVSSAKSIQEFFFQSFDRSQMKDTKILHFMVKWSFEMLSGTFFFQIQKCVETIAFEIHFDERM